LPARVRLRAALALLLPLAVVLAAAGPVARTFTDQFGRTFNGEMLDADETTAKVRREDGLVFELEIARLSPADVAYVAQWRRERVKYDLRVEIATFHLASPGTADSPATVRQAMSAGYDIKVTNAAHAQATGLRLEYNLFVGRLVGTATETREEGSAKLAPLALRESATVRTEPVIYEKRFSEQGTASQTAELRGLWVRILTEDGRVVAEQLTNDRLRDRGWREVASSSSRRGRATGSPFAPATPPPPGRAPSRGAP
jgi:hypothetical protein